MRLITYCITHSIIINNMIERAFQVVHIANAFLSTFVWVKYQERPLRRRRQRVQTCDSQKTLSSVQMPYLGLLCVGVCKSGIPTMYARFKYSTTSYELGAR